MCQLMAWSPSRISTPKETLCAISAMVNSTGDTDQSASRIAHPMAKEKIAWMAATSSTDGA